VNTPHPQGGTGPSSALPPEPRGRAQRSRAGSKVSAHPLENIQLNRYDLKALTPEEIEPLRTSGRLDRLLNITREN